MADIFRDGEERCVQGFGGETAWKTGSKWEDNIKNISSRKWTGFEPYWCDCERDKSWCLVNRTIETSGSVKCGDFFWLAGDLVVYQGGLISGTVTTTRCAEVMVCQHVAACCVTLTVRSTLCSFTVCSVHCLAILLHAFSFSNRGSSPRPIYCRESSSS